MNDKLKYDHFKNTEEVLRHIALWYWEDDIEYPRWFGLNDLNNLRIYIEQLQSNWNSLREWLEQQKTTWNIIQEHGGYDYEQILDKMNELEGENNEENM